MALHEKLVDELINIIDALDVSQRIVMVGGGAVLFNKENLLRALQKRMPRIKEIVIPADGNVANALGAARSLIGAQFTRMYS